MKKLEDIFANVRKAIVLTVLLISWLVFRPIQLILAWMAGCNIPTLINCPSAELNKKSGIGLAMLAAIIVAGMGAGEAARAFLHTESGTGFAIMWASLVFAIDRSFIVFMDTKRARKIARPNADVKNNGATLVVLRIVIVLLMAFFTSSAVELRIFSTEVENQLQYAQNSQIAILADSSKVISDSLLIEKEILQDSVDAKARNHQTWRTANITPELKSAEQIWINAKDSLRKEILQGGTGRGRGYGNVAKALQAMASSDSLAYENKKEEMQQVEQNSATYLSWQDAIKFAERRAKEIDRDIKTVQGNFDRKIERVENELYGFLDKMGALHHLLMNSPQWYQILIVIAIIALIELFPIILKMLSGYGPYEDQLAIEFEKHDVEEIQAKQKVMLENNAVHQEEVLKFTIRQNAALEKIERNEFEKAETLARIKADKADALAREAKRTSAATNEIEEEKYNLIKKREGRMIKLITSEVLKLRNYIDKVKDSLDGAPSDVTLDNLYRNLARYAETQIKQVMEKK